MRMMSTLVVEDHDDFKTYYFALALNSDSNRGGRDRGGEKNRENMYNEHYAYGLEFCTGIATHRGPMSSAKVNCIVD